MNGDYRLGLVCRVFEKRGGAEGGDKLVILEAMKMLTTVSAQTDGTIKEIIAKKGTQVDSDDLLVIMEA